MGVYLRFYLQMFGAIARIFLLYFFVRRFSSSNLRSMCAAEMQRNASKSDRNIGLDFQQDWTFLQVAQAYPALRLASEDIVDAVVRDHFADIKVLLKHIVLRPVGIE